MPYQDFQQSSGYGSKTAGASIEIILINESDPTKSYVGKTTGMSWNDDFEALPVEEAGNDGVDEIVQGRHTTNFSIPAFYSPQFSDQMPTRQDFLGHKWTCLWRIASPYPNAGTVLQAHTGGVISNVSSQLGARGLVTSNLSFVAERRYSGKEWSDLTGS